MKLEEIGFYTLSDDRARFLSRSSPMMRGEIIITDRCNFACPYCRGIRPDCKGQMPTDEVCRIIRLWASDGLRNIRFSGGEPTLHNGLTSMVAVAKANGVRNVAISTNGSADWNLYRDLISCGANDFSVSLDACCSSFGDKMSGVNGYFDKVCDNIRRLSLTPLVYVTVGVVLNEMNVDELANIVKFADSLGVDDIRIIPSAQYNRMLASAASLNPDLVRRYPILSYRVNHIRNNVPVRGLCSADCHKCHLVQDDSAVAGNFHFPCIIALREGCLPIGKIGPNMREERIEWSRTHDTFLDPICRKNCLDVCVAFNNRVEKLKE